MKSALCQIRLHDLALPLADHPHHQLYPLEQLSQLAAGRLGIPAAQIQKLNVTRRALDTRHRRLRYIYSVAIEVAQPLAARLIQAGKAESAPEPQRGFWRLRACPPGPPPVVVGAGPAGLFAALTLAQGGWPPLIFERGHALEQRGREVSALYARGILNPDSNVCFGEGGAGTYSDGKLYTRVHDDRVGRVLATLVELGARPEICIEHRPHVGTDRLVVLLGALRRRLHDLGATYHFGSPISGLTIRDRALLGLHLQDGSYVDAPRVVLATGHSARDVWHFLAAAGLTLEPRPFAVGLRIEHPQELINHIRYGQAAQAHGQLLPAADYRLIHHAATPQEASTWPSGRGVYSFCMCPGGVVVPTPTEPQGLCINGMSHAARSGRFANSALVVQVNAADFAHAGHSGTFAGVAFQRAIEQQAFAAGGDGFAAPASRVTDFLAGSSSTTLPASSYRRGLVAADLAALYPPAVTAALRAALVQFDKKMPGFVTAEASLIGVETRTAAPLRLPRGADYQAVGAAGLFPVGEGLGFGGGIVSAAVDGMRAAEALLQQSGALWEAAPC